MFYFTAWLKTDGKSAKVRLQAYSWKENVHNWLAFTACRATGQWHRYDLLFRLPGRDSLDYRPTMKTFFLWLAVISVPGRVWVDDVALRAAELESEWAAWRAQGQDRHSLVADPLFANPGRDDYRLRPQSPAFRPTRSPESAPTVTRCGPPDPSSRHQVRGKFYASCSGEWEKIDGG